MYPFIQCSKKTHAWRVLLHVDNGHPKTLVAKFYHLPCFSVAYEKIQFATFDFIEIVTLWDYYTIPRFASSYFVSPVDTCIPRNAATMFKSCFDKTFHVFLILIRPRITDEGSIPATR